MPMKQKDYLTICLRKSHAHGSISVCNIEQISKKATFLSKKFGYVIFCIIFANELREDAQLISFRAQVLVNFTSIISLLSGH